MAAALAIGVGPVTARSRTGFGQVQRYVFVPEAGSQRIEIIDTGLDRHVGTLAIGIVPRQVEVSAALAKLVAIDGRSNTLVIGDLVTGSASEIPLSAAAGRITLSPDGRTVATADLDGGEVAFVDLLAGREVAHAHAVAPVRDIMFSGSAGVLYYTSAGLGAVGVIDSRSGRLAAPIAVPHAGPAGLAALRRSFDGRHVFVHAPGGPIGVIDLERGMAVADIGADPRGAALFPSGAGTALIMLEPAAERVSVLRDATTKPVVLAGTAGMDAVYPAWLDTTAFVPSHTRHSLLVYDLDVPQLLDEITLAGVPMRGAVTADSQKLYLPLAGVRNLLVVVNTRTHQVAKLIELAGEPLAAVIAGGFGICH